MSKQANNFQFQKGLLAKGQEKLFTFIGDLTWQGAKCPFWVVYAPTSYKLKGDDSDTVSRLIYDNHLRPGDVFLRKYDKYWSSFFIPGDLKHAGMYVGKIAWEDGIKRHTVVHSMSEGVLKANAIDFFRTDHAVIFRPSLPEKACELAAKRALDCLGRPYDFDFRYTDHKALYCTELIGYAYDFTDEERQTLKENYNFTDDDLVFRFHLVKEKRIGATREVLLADNIMLSNGEVMFMSKGMDKTEVFKKYTELRLKEGTTPNFALHVLKMDKMSL